LIDEGTAADEYRKIMENKTPLTSIWNVSNDSSRIVEDEIYDQSTIMFSDKNDGRRLCKTDERPKIRRLESGGKDLACSPGTMYENSVVTSYLRSSTRFSYVEGFVNFSREDHKYTHE